MEYKEELELLQSVVKAAGVTQGMITPETPTPRNDFYIRIAQNLAKGCNKKIVLAKGGIIRENAAYLIRADDVEIKTSVVVSLCDGPQTNYVETLNTIYIVEPGAKPFDDLRYPA